MASSLKHNASLLGNLSCSLYVKLLSNKLKGQSRVEHISLLRPESSLMKLYINSLDVDLYLDLHQNVKMSKNAREVLL